MKRLPVLLILTVGLLASCAQTDDASTAGAGPRERSRRG